MTLIIQSANTTTVGVNTSLTVAGDDFHLLGGVLLASTTSTGIDLQAADINLRIDGIVSAVSAVNATSAGNFSLVVGATGVLYSTLSTSSAFGVALRGGASEVSNRGEISSPEAIALFVRDSNNDVQNFGTISGVTGLQLFSESSNDVV